MNSNHQLYLNKSKTVDLHIMNAGDKNHVSFYNDETNKSVAYICNNDELKELADFIYKNMILSPEIVMILSKEEISLIIDMIENQLDIIYNNGIKSTEFMQKRIEALLNMRKKLEKYDQ